MAEGKKANSIIFSIKEWMIQYITEAVKHL
jgi:hypothetical protein